MLQLIRDHAQGVIVWTIIGLICITFALVGVNAYFSGDGKSYVAKVNSTKIPYSEYQLAIQRERAFRQQIFGDNISPAMLEESALRKAAIDRLVSSEVIAQAADEGGLRLGDAQLAAQIHQMQEFQSDGMFDQAKYVRMVRNQGLNEQGFEMLLRRDLLSRQLMDSVMESELLTAVELDAILRLKKQQRQFGYMVLPVADVMDEVKVSDEQIQAYYAENGQQYLSQEMASIEYLELNAAEMMLKIDMPDEETLQRLYQEQLAAYAVGEERRASHILIKPEDETKQAQQAAQELAAQLRQQLVEGADFAELAKQYSADPGSAAQGGDLGFFGRGMMVGAFEDAAFAMQVNEISEPVKSPYGLHIIRLDDVKGGETRPFAEVRDELIAEYRQQQADEQFFELADLMVNLTFEHPDTLTIAAVDLGLDIKSSELFSRQFGTGVASDERVREAAFSPDVLETGNNSDVITLAQNHVIVLRLQEHRPATQQSLKEVKGQIEQRLRTEQARNRIREQGEKIFTRLQDQENAQQLAQEQGLDWQTTDYVERSATELNAEILKHAFAMRHPAADKATFSAFQMNNGDYAVIALAGVQQADVAAVGEDLRQREKEQRIQALGQMMMAKMLDSLKQRAAIKEYDVAAISQP